AMDRGATWFMVVFTVLVPGFAVFSIPWTAPDWQPMTAICTGLFIAVFWGYFLAQTVRLLGSAHLLRLPGTVRQLQTSLLLYALLTIALPTLLIGLAGSHGL